MRLLVLTPLPSPFVREAFQLLARRHESLEVKAVFYGDASHRPTWGKLIWEGVQISGSIRQRLSSLRKIVHDYKPDQVVLGQYNRAESWWLKRYAKKIGIPAHVFFVEPLIPSNRFKSWFKLKLCGRYFAGLQSVGCMGRRAYDEYARVYKGTIFSCPYTFDLSTLKTFDGSERVAGRVTFLYSGRLCAFRDPLLALRCFAQIRGRMGDKVHFIISGKGELDSEVHAAIKALDLESAVTWMNDFKDWEDLRNLYRHADVLLSLGIYNTWSLTIQEAMAAGMGVVATHTTEAANELIIDGHNGYLVDHDNPAAIVQALSRYATDSGLAHVHGARSREIVDVVDVDVVASRIAEVLGL